MKQRIIAQKRQEYIRNFYSLVTVMGKMDGRGTPRGIISNWMLVDGVIKLLLGLMIYEQWPWSSAWAIGTLVGISLIFSGVARVMMSLAVRKATGEISSSSSLAA